MQRAVSFSFIKTANDYREVLALRKLAYSLVGKADQHQSPDVMSDDFDAKSRILTARHKGEIVGSLRLTFHQPGEENEYDQFVRLPGDFFPRDQIIVLSRICTHPDYRGSDLFYGLIRHCLLTVVQLRKRYILGGCSDSLLPLYERIGFKPQGLFFEHATLKDVREQIIVLDVEGVLSGKDVTAETFAKLYSDLNSYISRLYLSAPSGR